MNVKCVIFCNLFKSGTAEEWSRIFKNINKNTWKSISPCRVITVLSWPRSLVAGAEVEQNKKKRKCSYFTYCVPASLCYQCMKWFEKYFYSRVQCHFTWIYYCQHNIRHKTWEKFPLENNLLKMAILILKIFQSLAEEWKLKNISFQLFWCCQIFLPSCRRPLPAWHSICKNQH